MGEVNNLHVWNLDRECNADPLLSHPGGGSVRQFSVVPESVTATVLEGIILRFNTVEEGYWIII